MDVFPSAAELEPRKKVRVRFRRDLSVTVQKYEGRTYYMVKDPVSLRYFRYTEQEQFLIGLMDGRTTLEETQKQFEQHFRPERLSLEDLEMFAQQLLRLGLAYTESSLADRLFFTRRREQQRSQVLQSLSNFIYIK